MKLLKINLSDYYKVQFVYTCILPLNENRTLTVVLQGPQSATKIILKWTLCILKEYKKHKLSHAMILNGDQHNL